MQGFANPHQKLLIWQLCVEGAETELPSSPSAGRRRRVPERRGGWSRAGTHSQLSSPRQASTDGMPSKAKNSKAQGNRASVSKARVQYYEIIKVRRLEMSRLGVEAGWRGRVCVYVRAGRGVGRGVPEGSRAQTTPHSTNLRTHLRS